MKNFFWLSLRPEPCGESGREEGREGNKGRGTGAGLWNINNIFVPLFEWLHLSSAEIKQCCLKCADVE